LDLESVDVFSNHDSIEIEVFGLQPTQSAYCVIYFLQRLASGTATAYNHIETVTHGPTSVQEFLRSWSSYNDANLTAATNPRFSQSTAALNINSFPGRGWVIGSHTHIVENTAKAALSGTVRLSVSGYVAGSTDVGGFKPGIMSGTGTSTYSHRYGNTAYGRMGVTSWYMMDEQPVITNIGSAFKSSIDGFQIRMFQTDTSGSGFSGTAKLWGLPKT
jgi:hypothetical protein